jgi:nucleoside-diphosphate-sugar epimerase
MDDPQGEGERRTDRAPTALVTGATGFIGGHLVRALVAAGTRVRVLARHPERLDRALVDRLEVVRGDLLDPRSLKGLGDGVDRVFHVAAQLNLHGVTKAQYAATNLGGTENLIDALAGAPLRSFVHVSSIAAIGIRHVGLIDEAFPCSPDLDYGVSKLAMDEALLRAHRERGLPVVIVRPPTVYGPGERYNFLSLCRAIASRRFLLIGSGDNRVDFLWVGALVDAMIGAAERGRAGHVYLVADQPPRPFRATVDVLSELLRGRPWRAPHLPTSLAYAVARPLARLGALTGLPVPLYPTRVRTMTSDMCFDLRKLRDEVGVSAEVDFRLRAAETIRWYRSEGLLPPAASRSTELRT